MPPAFSTFSPTLFLIGAAFIGVAYIALIYYKRSRQLKNLEAQGIAESPFKRHPIFGHAMHMRELGFSRFVLQSSVRLGPERGRIFAVCIGPVVYLVSTDPDVMQTVTKTNNLPKGVYHNLTPILGSGLLTNRGGEDWKRKRILFMEAFSVPYLKQVVPPAVTGVSNELVKRIDASIAKNQSVDIQSVLLLCSLDLIGLVGFGHDFGCTRGDVDADVLTMMHVCLKEPTVRFFNPFARFYRLREAAEFNRQLKAFKNFALDVIRANKNPDISGERRKNILSVALSSRRTEKKGHEFSDADLVNEVSTFLFAGHETTGATMCFAILMLGVDPAWQDKARAEVDSVMGDRLIPTFEDQNRLHTLGNIIKEILRLFPAAPGSLRVTQEDTRVLDYTVPKGTNVMPVFMAMQRHPKNFPDAKKFDPTRWEKVESDEGRADEPVSKDESTKSPHTYAYVPFSAGPRNCIGMHFANMEMRLIIARLLRRYTWTIEILEPGVEATPEGIMEYYEEEVTVHAKPFKTHFTVRKNQL